MKFSVCIPVHNVEPYLEKTARSLFGQTAEDVEFIFVDDASTDGSVRVLKDVLADYPARKGAVRILTHETACGALASRREAAVAATGDLIAFCDSDDWLDPDYLATLARAFENPEVDLAFAPMVRNENDPIPGERDLVFSGSGDDYLGAVGRIVAFNSMVNKAYRRSLLVDFPEVPEGLRIAEDLCWTAQIVSRARQIVSVRGVAYHYRVNTGSLSRALDSRRAVDDLVRVYRHLVSRLPASGAVLRKQLLRDILYFDLRFGGLCVGDRRALYRDFRSLKDVPWSPDTSRIRKVLVLLGSIAYRPVRILLEAISFKKVKGF